MKKICLNHLKTQECFDYKFLPPYSPNLNPIENVFGIIQNISDHSYQMNSKKYMYLLEAQDQPKGQKGKQKTKILDGAFEMAIKKVTIEMVNNCYGHLLEYFEKVRNYEDI